LRSFISCLGH